MNSPQPVWCIIATFKCLQPKARNRFLVQRKPARETKYFGNQCNLKATAVFSYTIPYMFILMLAFHVNTTTFVLEIIFTKQFEHTLAF